jgi:hypothetical protein
VVINVCAHQENLVKNKNLYKMYKMPNYHNSKIYRIVCDTTGKQYIGSTTIPLSARLAQHKKTYKTTKNCLSREVLENNNFQIILIEDFPCDRREILLQRERVYIETMDCVNKNIPLRTKEEWYQDNKERIIEKQLEWNNKNREKLREYQRKYRNKLVHFPAAWEDNPEHEHEILLEEIYNETI